MTSPATFGSGSSADLHWRWWGAAGGLLVGVSDYGLVHVLGGHIIDRDGDTAWWAVALFISTYALLGFLVGWLAALRRAVTAHAHVIETQLAALERSQGQVVQAEKLASLGRVAAGVAHEVRNSLGVIRASVGLFTEQQSAGPQEDLRRAGHFITAEIDRLDRFVRTLLDFSRPIRPQREQVTLEQLAERAQGTAGLADVELRIEPEVRALSAWVDADLVGRALAILLLNAAEAGATAVHVDGAVEDSWVRLRVRDDGPGITGVDRDRIFEPFFTTKTEGTGLGLPLAGRIIEAHGGSLQLATGADGDPTGACFELVLPARASAEAAA